ncbi:hypothetical protein P3547_19920 [Vibrio parahaemolyticus]|nr:hypothetical protein [Vibrio parahaemolyticus]
MSYKGVNTPDNTVGYIGNGAMLLSVLDENDKPTHFYNVGQVSSASISLSQETATIKDTMSGSLSDAQSAVIGTSAEASLSLASFDPEMLALALFGEKNEDAAETGKTQTFNVKLGYSAVVEGIIKEVTSIVRTSDSADVTENFIVSNGSLFAVKDQSGFTNALVDGDELTITYDTHAVDRVEGFVASSVNVALVFDGINVARSGRPVKVTYHKVQLSPTTARQLISTEYGSHEITGKLLASKAITGTGLSKLFKEEHV